MIGWLILGACLVALFTWSLCAIAASSDDPPAGDPVAMRDANRERRWRSDIQIIDATERFQRQQMSGEETATEKGAGLPHAPTVRSTRDGSPDNPNDPAAIDLALRRHNQFHRDGTYPEGDSA